MKYSEAEKQIKALSSKYEAKMGDGDFNVVYNGRECGIYVSGSCEYSLYVNYPKNFFGMPFSKNLYMILAELAITPLDEREKVKKYYVKVFNNEFGYLNINILTGKVTADDMRESDANKTKFTDKAIEQLKQRDDIALDWDKANFDEVEDDD